MPKINRKLIFSLSAIAFALTLPTKALAGTTPPTTTITQTPNSPDGNNGWYVSPIQFDLEATDLESGVKSINYRIDSGTWQTVNYSDTLNLIQNPSFETSGATSTGIYQWESTTLDAFTTYSQDPVIFAPNYANSSAKITTTDTSGTWHGINNAENYGVAYAYENMTASAWVKTQDISGSAYFKIYSIAQDEFGNQVVTQLTQSSTIAGTQDWTKLSVSFSALPQTVIGIYMDIGLEGAGSLWVDAATINSASQNAQTSIIIASDGQNKTIEYYATDQAGNVEYSSCVAPRVNCIEFNIDTTKPGNWGQSGATRLKGAGGNDHTLFVFTNVEDETSGLDVTESSQYTYKIDEEEDFGRYPDITQCNQTWQTGEWVDLNEGPTNDGDKQALLQTQATDLCNNNWKICKIIKFKAVDMAGNESLKDFCINGPWIRIRGEAHTRSNYYIDMVAEPEGDNTDGIIEIGNSTANFFTSSKNWKINHSPIFQSLSYNQLSNMITQTKSSFSGDLPTSSGVFEVNGDFTIVKQDIPNNYDNDTFNQVYFIDGNLTIEDSISTDTTSAVLFIVNGDVNISKSVTNLDIAVIAEGNIYTAYDVDLGDATPTLEWNGLAHGERIILQRTLQGTNNDDTPSEDFTYEAKYLIKLRDFFGKNTVSWRAIN